MAGDFSENASLLLRVKNGDESAIDELMRINSGLVGSLAKRFIGRGCEFEDLVQIGNIGMLKAIRSFDVSRGVVFSTYATPLIIGEIRRHLRDDGMIKVGREIKRLGIALMREREKFASEFGREPHISELAERCSCSLEDAVDALGGVSQVLSLSEPASSDGEFTIESTVSSYKDSLDGEVEKIALAESIKKLPPLWRKIIVLRYFKDLSQQETAERLGLSQVKVSREEKKIIAQLRRDLV